MKIKRNIIGEKEKICFDDYIKKTSRTPERVIQITRFYTLPGSDKIFKSRYFQG